MKKIILLFCGFIAFINFTCSQTVFQKIYPNIFQFSSIEQTSDGGYILVGRDDSPHSYLLKLDSNGNAIWNKKFGDNDTLQITLASIHQTSDGGYIAVGTIFLKTFTPFTDSSRVYLVKTNATGDTLWTKCYIGFKGSSFNVAGSVKQTSDGGYIIAGATVNQISGVESAYIIKVDANGNLLWSKTISTLITNSYTTFSDFQITNDGGYILTGIGGYSSIYGIPGGMFIVKLNSSGDTLWTREFLQSSFNSFPFGSSVIQTIDGGYMLLGNSDYSHNLIGQSPLIKLNSSGDTSWTKSFGFIYGRGYLNTVRQTSDGGYIIGGWIEQDTNMNLGSYSLLIKTNGSGDTLWTKIYGKNDSVNFSSVNTYNMTQTSDGGTVLVGLTYNFGKGAFIIKSDSLGNTTCNVGHAIFSIMKLPFSVYSGTIIDTGSIESCIPVTISSVDTSSIDPCLFTGDINEVHIENNFLIYPNPAENNLIIDIAIRATIEISNIEGQIIKRLQTKDTKTDIDISGFSSGVYIIIATTDKGIIAKKFIKE